VTEPREFQGQPRTELVRLVEQARENFDGLVWLHRKIRARQRRTSSRQTVVFGAVFGMLCGVSFAWVAAVPFAWTMAVAVLVGSAVGSVGLYFWLRRIDRRTDEEDGQP